MASGYKNEPVDEYGEIFSNLREVLPSAEEYFDTADLRMMLVIESNNSDEIDSLNNPQINWGLDYLSRQELVDHEEDKDVGVCANHNRDWFKNGYTDEKLEEVIDELEY